MSKATARTRQQACEAYEHRWQRKNLTEEQWAEVLDLLYDGKGPTQIVRKLNLDPVCKSSLTLHARTHRGFIAFMRGVRLKDKRLQMGAALSDAWQALLSKIFQIALDESTKPGIRVAAAELARKEMGELQKLAQAASAEFNAEEHKGEGLGDLQGMVEQIASQVFGIRPRGNDSA